MAVMVVDMEVKERRIMLSYDENGNFRDYEEYEQKVVCGQCHKTYLQETIEQVAGFREVDDDVCPYCGYINARSGAVEFFNHKLGDNDYAE